jgi:hypothetical protein
MIYSISTFCNKWPQCIGFRSKFDRWSEDLSKIKILLVCIKKKKNLIYQSGQFNQNLMPCKLYHFLKYFTHETLAIEMIFGMLGSWESIK